MWIVDEHDESISLMMEKCVWWWRWYTLNCELGNVRNSSFLGDISVVLISSRKMKNDFALLSLLTDSSVRVVCACSFLRFFFRFIDNFMNIPLTLSLSRRTRHEKDFRFFFLLLLCFMLWWRIVRKLGNWYFLADDRTTTNLKSQTFVRYFSQNWRLHG